MALNKRKKVLIYLLVAVNILTAIMAIAGMCIPTDSIRLKFQEPANYSRGWINEATGEIITEDSRPLAEGESITIHKKLPSKMSEGSNLILKETNFHIRAYVDGQFIYEIGENSNLKFGTEIGRVWIAIPLPSDSDGKQIELCIENFGGKRQVEIQSLAIGTESDLNYVVLKDNIANIVESSLAFLLGILLLIYAFALKKNQIKDAKKAILYLALVSVTCGIWFVMDGDMMQFFASNGSVKYVWSYVSLCFMPIGMLLFFREILHYGKKLLTILIDIQLGVTFVIFLLYVTNLVHISKVLPLIHASILALAVIVIVLTVIGLIRDRDVTMIGPLVAFVVLDVAGVIYLIWFYTAPNYTSASLFRRSFLLFLLILCMTTVRQSLQKFKDVLSWNHYKELAYVDTVTGGNTRSRFEEMLAEKLHNQYEGYWLIHMNLIGFKMVNEILGWENGSKLLKSIYTSCETLLDREECICNLGNASMAILVKAKDLDELHWKVNKLRRETTNSAHRMRDNLALNIHLCVSPVTSAEDTIDILLDHALMANQNPSAEYWQELECYIYNEECRDRLVSEKDMESRLHQALANHEFEMYLQSKINPRDGSLGGAEALVRWNSPIDGLIPPSKFVPLFERLGVISQVDLYMFREVCTLLCRWKMEGKTPIVISVNVSKLAFEQPDFMRNYEQILKETGAPAEYIEFEFTESIAYSNTKMMNQIMKWIHSQGAKCSMDDFGSSYSNLSAIQTLDFDTVKMDKCFFDHGFPGSERAEKMILGLIHTLKSLGIKVVTEGIETEEQMKLLKEMQCDLIQGYYYSKPIPVKEFEKKYQI